MFRIGISGCGYWGVQLIRTAKKMEDVTVEAIADPDAGAGQRAASLLNGEVKTHSSFEMLLSDKIDGVIIASPPAYHVEQAVAALKRGKAVFIEKPPAMNLSDMDRLLNAASGKTLLCDYVFVYNPLVQFIKSWLKEIDFRLITADLRWTNWGIVRRDVDAWWSVGPHPVSVLAYLFGQIERQWLEKGEGWARSHFVFPSDRPRAGVFVSWCHPIKERRVELVGLNHTIVMNDAPGARKLWVIRHDDLEGRFSPRVDYKPEPLAAALLDFVHCARTGDEPISGASMIEKVTRLMV